MSAVAVYDNPASSPPTWKTTPDPFAHRDTGTVPIFAAQPARGLSPFLPASPAILPLAPLLIEADQRRSAQRVGCSASATRDRCATRGLSPSRASLISPLALAVAPSASAIPEPSPSTQSPQYMLLTPFPPLLLPKHAHLFMFQETAGVRSIAEATNRTPLNRSCERAPFRELGPQPWSQPTLYTLRAGRAGRQAKIFGPLDVYCSFFFSPFLPPFLPMPSFCWTFSRCSGVKTCMTCFKVAPTSS